MSSIDEQAALWVTRMADAPDAQTRAAFNAWHDADRRHQGAYLRAEAAWLMMDRAQVMAHGDEQSAGDSLHATLKADRTAHTRRYMLSGAVAASVAATVGIGYVLKDRMSFSTQRGELRHVPLADHSVASVNTDSQIDVDMTPDLRHVQLIKGEAWFEVAKNPERPFVVSAGDVRVRAVGTAFSVRRRDKGADVLVTEGVVEAWNVNDKTKRVTLSAGAEAFVPNHADTVAIAYHPEEIERKLAWREREIVLNGMPLSDAVAEFNRYNKQEIVIDDPSISGAQLVGGFEVDQPESFARAVHAALNVPVEVSDNRIIIGTLRAAS